MILIWFNFAANNLKIMKSIFSILKIKWIFFLLVLSLGYVNAQSKIEGVWNSGRDNTDIEILEENGEWVGKIKSSDNEKAILGKVILKDLEKQGDKWVGQLFVIRQKKWVDVTITPKENNLDLIVSAGFRKKEVQWLKSNK